MAGVTSDRELIVRDYLPTGRKARTSESVLAALDELTAADLLDLNLVASALGYGTAPEGLEQAVSPRGYRLLSRAPRLPGTVLDRVVEHFGSLQKILAATADDLQNVEGIGETRARTVREALSRLADASIVERYN